MDENKLYVKNINGYYLKDEDAREELENKSDIGHTHTKSEITDFTHSHDLSDLNNDTGFIDKDVNNLTNYTNNTNLIGAILESGSNANGNYIKFADGTMICWKYFSADVEYASSSTAGTMMCRGVYPKASLPANFISRPVVSAGCNAICEVAYNDEATTKWPPIHCFLPYTAGQTYTTHFELIAIGKWK